VHPEFRRSGRIEQLCNTKFLVSPHQTLGKSSLDATGTFLYYFNQLGFSLQHAGLSNCSKHMGVKFLQNVSSKILRNFVGFTECYTEMFLQNFNVLIYYIEHMLN
jgi:hypothetical protein